MPRLDLRLAAWAVGAAVLSLGAGLLTGASATAGLDAAIVLGAAVLRALEAHAGHTSFI